jgi:hypothetical protein
MREIGSRLILWGSFLGLAAFGQSTIKDVNWISIPGTNKNVSALVVSPAGVLYAAGSFDSTGSEKANNVACWNGSAWSALGSGTNGTVYALAVDDSGNMYAGGNFDTAGNVRVNHVARWNGTTWSALDSGMSGNVGALTVDHAGNLCAEEFFDSASHGYARISRWNSHTWNSLGNSVFSGNAWGNSVINGMSSLAVNDSNNVFTHSGELIYKWNGSKWDTIGGVGGNSDINTIAIDKSNNLYTGGLLEAPGGYCGVRMGPTELGTLSWSAGNSLPYVSTMAFDTSGNLYVGGNFYLASGVPASCVARWDGHSWSSLGSGLAAKLTRIPPVEVYALVIDKSGNLYVSGIFDTAGGKPAAGLARCNINGTAAETSHFGTTKQAAAPFLRTGNIHFSLTQASVVAFKILDISGRELVQSPALAFGPGNHMYKISTATLRPGVYFLDFNVGNTSYRGKFSVMK